jgi:hypothetical protein
MLLNVFRKFLYIHIPRCAGTSVTKTLFQICPNSLIDELEWKHVHAPQFKFLIRDDEWDAYYKFTTLRSPWEIIESDWRHVHRLPRIVHPPEKLIGNWWLQRVNRVFSYPNFSEFVEHEYLIKSENQLVYEGGFWKTFCCDKAGNDLDIDVILCNDLLNKWEDICRRIGIISLPLPYLNHAISDCGCWNQNIIDKVGNHCYLDIEKFNFTPPKYNKDIK